MSQATQQDMEDAIIDIITAIYASKIIPESHKDKYVEHIEVNGMTEKMLTELQKIFAEEEKGIEKDLSEKQELLAELDGLIKEETEKNDEQQAEILAAVDSFAEEQPKKMEKELQEVQEDMEDAVEELKTESESAEIADIKAKLEKK